MNCSLLLITCNAPFSWLFAGLLSGSSKKKKKKKKKKDFDGDPHDYLKRKSKSLKVTNGGKIDLKGGVGRARRRRRKLLLEKQKMQQEQLENRQRRRGTFKWRIETKETKESKKKESKKKESKKKPKKNQKNQKLNCNGFTVKF